MIKVQNSNQMIDDKSNVDSTRSLPHLPQDAKIQFLITKDTIKKCLKYLHSPKHQNR